MGHCSHSRYSGELLKKIERYIDTFVRLVDKFMIVNVNVNAIPQKFGSVPWTGLYFFAEFHVKSFTEEEE
jgi:hypothetical protein